MQGSLRPYIQSSVAADLWANLCKGTETVTRGVGSAGESIIVPEIEEYCDMEDM